MHRANDTSTIRDVEQLEDLLSAPPDYLADEFRKVKGDIIVLGVAGKMGPTLARMAQRALRGAGASGRVIGVARFSNPSEPRKLESWGIQTIRADLLDDDQRDGDYDHHPEQVVAVLRPDRGISGDPSGVVAGVCRDQAWPEDSE